MRRLAPLLVVALLLVRCTAPDLPARSPGDAPDLGSDEAGLWMTMNKAEQAIATSGDVVKDPVLQGFLREITCRLAPDHCLDIRILIIETPESNASMAPNGLMQVWTGLLLRAQNEAEVASVIGHEITHFVERHSIERLMQMRASMDAAAFFSLGAAAAGVPSLGTVGQLAALGSFYAFSRDHERQADELGIRLLSKAGYDPRMAAESWRGLIAENEAGDKERPPQFFATHPDPGERVATLDALAAELRPDGGGELGTERFYTAVLPHRAAWMHSLFRVRDFDRHRVVLDRMHEAGHNPAELQFFEGEFHRLRGEDGDEAKAVATYEKAISLGAVPPETYRGLGQVQARLGQNESARRALETYLDQEPAASDRAMIEAEIAQLR